MNLMESNLTDFNAVITGKQLIAFPELSVEQRQDITDLMMYAEFYASQAWRREQQWTSWMQYYRSQLVTSGCKLLSNIVKQPMYITSASELEHMDFGVTGTVNVKRLLELVQRSFKAAEISQFARHFFEFGSASGFNSAFQMVPCERVSADEVSILICGLHASAKVTSGSLGGSWQVNREMVVRISGGVYSFSQQAYSKRRDTIRKCLKEVALYNFQGVDI